MDDNNIQFTSSLCALVERRVKDYAEIQAKDDNDYRNDVIGDVMFDMIIGLSAFYLSGYILEDERDEALEDLIDNLYILKQIDLVKEKQNAAKHH